jgi:hypothetical protein
MVVLVRTTRTLVSRRPLMISVLLILLAVLRRVVRRGLEPLAFGAVRPFGRALKPTIPLAAFVFLAAFVPGMAITIDPDVIWAIVISAIVVVVINGYRRLVINCHGRRAVYLANGAAANGCHRREHDTSEQCFPSPLDPIHKLPSTPFFSV